MDEASDELPWGEARWEAFLRDADLRADRYAERLETELGRRDRGEIADVDRDAIAQDMGWDRPDTFDVPEPTPEDLADAEVEERESEAALQRIPAYRLSLRIGRQVRRLLGGPERHASADDETVERLGAVWIAADIAGAKVSGGHAMGTEDDQLCGNIVNVRRGLAAVVEGRVALTTLAADGTIAADVAREIDARLARLATSIEAHVASLRERVWWE